MDFQNSPQNGNAHSLPIFVFYELRTFKIDQSTESFGKLHHNIDMTCFNVTTEQKEQSQGNQESKDIDDNGGDDDDK